MKITQIKTWLVEGILMGFSSEVHDIVLVENALRMYETVRKYGSYPINVGRC